MQIPRPHHRGTKSQFLGDRTHQLAFSTTILGNFAQEPLWLGTTVPDQCFPTFLDHAPSSEFFELSLSIYVGSLLINPLYVFMPNIYVFKCKKWWDFCISILRWYWFLVCLFVCSSCWGLVLTLCRILLFSLNRFQSLALRLSVLWRLVELTQDHMSVLFFCQIYQHCFLW